MAWVAAGSWIALGAVVYYRYSRHREEAFAEREKWMERIERKEYRVLVAFSSPRVGLGSAKAIERGWEGLLGKKREP